MLAESSLAKICYNDKNTFASITTSTSVQKGSNIGQPKPTLPQQQEFQREPASTYVSYHRFCHISPKSVSDINWCKGLANGVSSGRKVLCYPLPWDASLLQEESSNSLVHVQLLPLFGHPSWKREIKLENATYTLFLLFSQQALAWGTGERTREIKEL